MDSVITGPAEKLLADFDPSCMGTEDCQYILRALEKRAFEYVVIALRAQGPLSQYKEVILDHLKSIFFISDDDFLLRLRLAANDPYLSKIAQELNPSYDNVGDWLSAGYSLVSLEFPHAIQTSNASNHAASVLSKEMQKEMSRHNSCLAEEKEALLKLLQLSKKPYVPEKLRRLLQDTEKDAHGRVDLVKEKTSATKHRQVGRPRRAESVGVSAVDLDLSKNKASTASNKAEDAYDNNIAANIETSRLQAANHLTLLANTSLEISSNNTQKVVPVKHEEADNHSHKVHGEFSIHYAAGANVVVVDPEDQNTVKEPKIRKRRTKVVDDATWVCARVQPFIFERAPAGQAKVPRGNPDKRTTKRATQAAQQQQASAVSYSSGGELGVNTYAQSSSNSNYYAAKNITYIGNVVGDDSHVLPKRNRTSSVGEEMTEDGRILHAYQKTQLQSTSRPLMSSSALPARSSYYTGGTLVVTSLNRNNYGAVQQQQYEDGATTILASSSSKPPPATTIIVTEAANNIATGRYVSDEMYLDSGGGVTTPMVSQEMVPSSAAAFGEVQLVDSSNGMVIGTVMNHHNDHVVDHHNYSQQLPAPPHKIPPISITASNSNDSSAAAASGLVALHNHRQQMPPMVTIEKQQPQQQHFGGGPSGLDFLASTASLLTPMQKGHHHGQSSSHPPLSSSSSSTPQQQQGPSTTSLSSSTTATVMVVTSGPPPVASTTAMTGPRSVSNLSHHRHFANDADSSMVQYVSKTTMPSATYPSEKLPSTAYQHQPAYFVGQAEQHQSTSTMVYHQQQAPTGSSTMVIENSVSGGPKPSSSSLSTLATKNSHQSMPSVKGEIAVNTSLAVQKRFPIKYVTKAAPASTPPAAVGDIRSGHQSSSNSSSGIGNTYGYTSASSPTLTNSSSPSTSSSTTTSIPPTSTKNFDHQATQEFLKQHAADNNGVLNEEVTLGSILRSKTTNLRNKLLSAAVGGKSVVVSSTSSASYPNVSGSLPSSPSSSTALTVVASSTAVVECSSSPDTTGGWINENIIAGEAGGCGSGRLSTTKTEAATVAPPSVSLPPQKLVNLPSDSGECTEFVTQETTSQKYSLSKEEM